MVKGRPQLRPPRRFLSPGVMCLDIDIEPPTGTLFTPKMNKYECTDKQTGSSMVTVMFGFPGMKPDDITIELLHNHVTISGEVVEAHTVEGDCRRIVRQIPDGKFSKVVKVPLGMRLEDFKARMENGLLVMKYPKDPPRQEPYRIPVE